MELLTIVGILIVLGLALVYLTMQKSGKLSNVNAFINLGKSCVQTKEESTPPIGPVEPQEEGNKEGRSDIPERKTEILAYLILSEYSLDPNGNWQHQADHPVSKEGFRKGMYISGKNNKKGKNIVCLDSDTSALVSDHHLRIGFIDGTEIPAMVDNYSTNGSAIWNPDKREYEALACDESARITNGTVVALGGKTYVKFRFEDATPAPDINGEEKKAKTPNGMPPLKGFAEPQKELSRVMPDLKEAAKNDLQAGPRTRSDTIIYTPRSSHNSKTPTYRDDNY